MTTIAFISPCGFGNLGDVAIQDAFISGVREQLGLATVISGITQNPEDTSRRHHVRAVPMDADAFRLRRPRPAASEAVEGGAEGTSPKRRALGALSQLARSAKRLAREVIHWTIAFREMRRVDVLVVSGGGQLDDHWDGPWRVPYALWKWSLVARLLRKDVVFLSVGAGTIDARLTRYFLRSALRRARYVSFRDEKTASRVHERRLSASTQIVPDLAFGHEAPRGGESAAPESTPRTIVVSPIAFLEPSTWPRKDGIAYGDHVNRTTELARLMLARGYRIVVCTSDTPDMKPATELYETLAADAPNAELRLAVTTTPTELLETFATADMAIASRLHGLILANIAGTPTIALSYDWKVDMHMRMVGLGDFVYPIESFDPRAVLGSAEAMLENREEIIANLSARCESLGDAVRAQYGNVFGPYASGAGSQHEHRVAVAGGAE